MRNFIQICSSVNGLYPGRYDNDIEMLGERVQLIHTHRIRQRQQRSKLWTIINKIIRIVATYPCNIPSVSSCQHWKSTRCHYSDALNIRSEKCGCEKRLTVIPYPPTIHSFDDAWDWTRWCCVGPFSLSFHCEKFPSVSALRHVWSAFPDSFSAVAFVADLCPVSISPTTFDRRNYPPAVCCACAEMPEPFAPIRRS